MQLRLKEAAKSKVVGFAGRSLPLFLRSQTDIEKLALIAQESKDKSLLDLFEVVPTAEELRAQKVANELPELPNDYNRSITGNTAKNEEAGSKGKQRRSARRQQANSL